MTFNGYLTSQEINELAQAAQDGGLLAVPRDLLLTGIPPAFISAMSLTDNPLDQFTLDLVRVNRVKRMAGGEIPVLILLRNAADRLRLLGRQEAEIFERALRRAEGAASGIPPPAPTQLPEAITIERTTGAGGTVSSPPVAPGKAKGPIGSLDVAIRAAVIGGIFVIIAALIPYILGSCSGTPQPGSSPSAGSPSPTPSAAAAASPRGVHVFSSDRYRLAGPSAADLEVHHGIWLCSSCITAARGRSRTRGGINVGGTAYH